MISRVISLCAPPAGWGWVWIPPRGAPGASLLRGSGNTLAPALAFAGTALVQIPLSGALTLGWGPFPRWGIAGAATAYLASFAIASLVLAVWLWNTALRPRRAHWQLEARLFREILRVGAVSSISALQTVLTAGV